MAGRGRGMTLPAWMTQGTAAQNAAAVPEASKSAAPAAATTTAATTTAATTTAAAVPVAAQHAPAAANPGDDPNNWSTHTAPDGRPYYFNRVLNISTYDQPSCLKPVAQPAAATAASTECKWREYFAPDGRPYYSDGKDSRWDMPEEFRQWKERQARAQPVVAQHTVPVQQPVPMQQPVAPVHHAQPAAFQPVPVAQAPQAVQPKFEPMRFSLDQRHEPLKIAIHSKPASTAPPAASEPPRAVPQPRQQVEQKREATPAATTKTTSATPTYATEAEAMDAFKAMLADFKIPSTMKWKDVDNQIGNQDPRWNALRSNGQKRQALAEYQNAKSKEEKQLQRQRARKARDNFLKMLAENTEIDHRTTWREATRILADEPRFTAVEDEREREEIYNDFVFELAKKEKQDREAAVSTALDVFREMIKNDPTVTNRSVWADFKETFSRFEDARLAPLGEQDMRRAFQDHVIELDRQHKAAERAEREERERLERQHRDELHNALLALIEQDKINPRTTWSEAQQELGDLHALKALDEKAAVDEFDRVVHDIERQLRTDIRNTRDAVRQFRLPLNSRTTFEEFLAAIGEWEHKLEDDGGRDEREMSLLRKEYSALKELAAERAKNLRIAFEEVKADAVKDEEERAKKQAKRERRFKALLEDFYYRSDHIGITWDEAKRELSDEREYRDLERSERKRLFHAHMEELASKMAVTKALKDNLAAEEKKHSADGERASENGDRGSQSPARSAERGRSRKRSTSRSRGASHSRSGSRSSRSRSDSRGRGRSRERVRTSSRSRARSRSDSRHEQVKRAKRGDLEVEAGQVQEESDPEHDDDKSRKRDKDKRKKKKHKHEKKSKKHKRSRRSASSDRSDSRKRSRRSRSRSRSRS